MSPSRSLYSNQQEPLLASQLTSELRRGKSRIKAMKDNDNCESKEVLKLERRFVDKNLYHHKLRQKRHITLIQDWRNQMKEIEDSKMFRKMYDRIGTEI